MSNREEKKAQFQEKSSGSLVRTIVALAIVVGVAAVSYFVIQDTPGIAQAGVQEVTAKDGVIRIPLKNINDGQAHYFTYKKGKGAVSFFVLKSEDGKYRAAFDACDVCYHAKKGYRQEGDMMVCNNCGMAFASNRINDVKGGCNPAPLNRKVDGSYLIITATDIEAGGWYFGV